MLIDEFNETVEWWIAALDQYDYKQLCTQPASSQWSLGQLYLHLVDDTNYYIEQMNACFFTDEHAGTSMTAAARRLFDNNSFPDRQIVGHPNNDFIPQPGSITVLKEALLALKNTMNAVATRMTDIPVKGKSRHPGFEYLDAGEWLQLACMHFRHHLRQKERIDAFLRGNQTEGSLAG